MRKSRLQLVAAGTLFALTALVLAGGYAVVDMVSRPGPATATQPSAETALNQIPVIVAARPLSRGAVIAAADLTNMGVVGALPSGMFSDITPIVGRTARLDLLPGQVIMAESLAADRAGAGLAALVPDGLRAVSIRVTDEIAVGNHLRPGDIADLHIVVHDRAMPQSATSAPRPGDVSEARILLQNVTVLTVGNSLSPVEDAKPETRRADLRDVTLAVTPEQASQLALVRSVASYYLSLRNGLDRETVPDRIIRLVDIRGQDAGQARRSPQNSQPEPARRTPSVEFLNGAQSVKLRPGSGG